MEDLLTTGFVPFLGGVALISLSGVMMPGPVFAVTMARGQRQPLAGAFISLGHALIELPVALLIYYGLDRLFTAQAWRTAIGLLGGAALVFIGLDMIRKRGVMDTPGVDLPHRSVVAGLVTSAANRYFFLWWATVGAALVLRASSWGVVGLGAFFAVHWSCDFGWSLFVSAASHKAGHLWSGRVHRFVFAACGIFLVGFGAWFIRAAVAG